MRADLVAQGRTRAAVAPGKFGALGPHLLRAQVGRTDGMSGECDRVSGESHCVTRPPDRVARQPYGLTGESDRLAGELHGVSRQPYGLTGESDRLGDSQLPAIFGPFSIANFSK